VDYLEQLQAEGSFDSHGCFTLDFAASRSRYLRLADSDPSAYLRLLLQGILASDPQRLEISSRGKQLTVRWEPEPEPKPKPKNGWTSQDLAPLRSYLQGAQDEYHHPCLQYLKLGLLLASCRPQLQVRLQVDRQVVEWQGQSFDWQVAKDSQRVLKLEKLGADWEVRSLDSDSFLSAWPEMCQLRTDLATARPQCFVQGREELPRVPYGWAMLAPEFLRVAIVHPEEGCNKVPILLEPPPRPVAWLQPVTQLVLALDGTPLSFRLRERRLAYFIARLYLGDVHLQEDFWGKAPARTHLSLLREGFPLDLPNGLIPRSCVVMLEASELSTDLSFKKPIRNAALLEKVQVARRLLHLAVEAGLRTVREAPAWQSFLQGSRLERLQSLQRELSRPSDRLASLLGV